MAGETELSKNEDWVTQLCKEQRPLDDITVWIEQVATPPLGN